MFKLAPGVVASISVEKKDNPTPFSITKAKAKDDTAKPWGFWTEGRQRGGVLSYLTSKSELIFCLGLWAWLNIVEDSAAAGSSNGGDAAASVVFLAVSLLATILSAATQPHNLTRGLLLGAVSFLSLCTGASHARLSGQLTVYAVGACVLVYCLPVGAPLGTVNERALVGAALVRVGSRVVRRSLAGPDGAADYVVSASGKSFEAVGLAVSSTSVTLASSFGGSAAAVAGVYLAMFQKPRSISVAVAVFLSGLLASVQMMHFAAAYLGALFDDDVACNGPSSSCEVAFASRRFFVSSNDPVALFACVGTSVLTRLQRDDFVRTGFLVRSGASGVTLLSSCLAAVFVLNVLLGGLELRAVPVLEVTLRCCAVVAAAQRERLVALALQLCALAPYLADESFDSDFLTHHVLVWSGGVCLVAFTSGLFNTLLFKLYRGGWAPVMETVYTVSLKGFLALELSLFLVTCTSFSCYNGQIFETSPEFAVQFISHHFLSVVTACFLLTSSWSVVSSFVYVALPCLAAVVYVVTTVGVASYTVVDQTCAVVTGVSGISIFAAVPFVT